MNFGERLVYARKKMGLTQDDLSRMSGIARTSVCSFETGDREPSMKSFRKLCVALKVSADYLLDIDLKKLYGMA
jgi:transcriptional regulator with XRE-family HTH domain